MTDQSWTDQSWILTYTGRRFWPLAPRIQDISIEDIAHALSNICRFTGHCRAFYSVAEHSLRASAHGPDYLKLALLLHDASEAYLCDISRPVKHSKEMEAYRKTEQRVQALIGEKFHVVFTDPLIHEIDNRMLMTERRDLMPAHIESWDNKWTIDNEQAYPDEHVTTPLYPQAARMLFLNTFDRLAPGLPLSR